MQATRSAVQLRAPAKVQTAARRQAVTVCSAVQPEQQQPRRVALALIAAAAFSLTAPMAEAVTAAKNSYKASSEGYTLEGTKKQGISAKRRKALLAKTRKAAEERAAGKQ